MRWEGSDRRRSAGSRQSFQGFPISWRIVLGSLAIAAIILAFISNPPKIMDLPKAAPEVKPTVVGAAIVSVPTIAPAAPSPTAAPTPASTPSAASGTRVHEVAQGDTLSTIAKKYYGDSNKWSKILDANKDTLKSADSQQVGQKLKIPD